MINLYQQKQNVDASKQWAEAYADLQEDELLQLYIVTLSWSEAGRRLLEQSRQLWQAHGLTTPFEAVIGKAAVSFGRRAYTGPREYYQSLIEQ